MHNSVETYIGRTQFDMAQLDKYIVVHANDGKIYLFDEIDALTLEQIKELLR